nr:hypothetical protein [Tanacetum cinerariifolium]
MKEKRGKVANGKLQLDAFKLIGHVAVTVARLPLAFWLGFTTVTMDIIYFLDALGWNDDYSAICGQHWEGVTTTFAFFLGDIRRVSPATCRRGKLSSVTCRREMDTEEGYKGIHSLTLCPGDNKGPTYFSLKQNLGSSKIFLEDMSPG